MQPRLAWVRPSSKLFARARLLNGDLVHVNAHARPWHIWRAVASLRWLVVAAKAGMLRHADHTEDGGLGYIALILGF